MQYYSHIDVTKLTYDRLHSLEAKGYVHSIYEHTINIVLHDRSLYTLSDETLNEGPNLIRIKGMNIKQLNVDEKDSVLITDNTLIIDDKLMLNLNHPKIFRSIEIVGEIESSLVFQKIELVRKSDWYRSYLSLYENDTFNFEVNKRIKKTQKKVMKHFANNDCVKILESMESIVGLGIGLTPSGDDFLTGLAFISSLLNSRLNNCMNSLKPIILKSTNIISHHQYVMALNGEIRSEVMLSVKALLSTESYQDSKEVIEGISNIGSTSGFDLLQGVIFGLELYLKEEKE